MGYVLLITIVNAAKVSVCDVPKCAREVFFPVLDTIVVFIARIFPASRICFTSVDHPVPVHVFFSVIKGVTIGVVVSRVTGLSRAAVLATHFDTIGNSVPICVRRGRIC